MEEASKDRKDGAPKQAGRAAPGDAGGGARGRAGEVPNPPATSGALAPPGASPGGLQSGPPGHETTGGEWGGPAGRGRRSLSVAITAWCWRGGSRRLSPGRPRTCDSGPVPGDLALCAEL